MGTPPSYTKVTYSTTGTGRDKILSVDSDGIEWIDFNDTSNEQEAYQQPGKADTHSTIRIERIVTYQTSPRKRSTRKAVQAAIPSRKPSSISSYSEDSHKDHDETRDIMLGAFLFKGAIFAGQYALSVLKCISRLARWPITFFIASVLFLTIVGYASRAIGRALHPFCIIPGISSMSICGLSSSLLTNSNRDLTSKWNNDAKLMAVHWQMQSFEQHLGDAIGSSALSSEIKKAELVTMDLLIRVRISNSKVKDALILSLSEFVQDAKKTRRGLQKLAANIRRSVDDMMAANNGALQSIAIVRESQRSPWPFRGPVPWAAPAQQINESVRRTLDDAMNIFFVNMERLVIETEQNLHHLNGLEERLVTLQEVLAHADSSILSAKSDLQEKLWTKFGGNRKFVRIHEYHLLLLKGWRGCRTQALVHIVAALQTLHAMSEDIQDMYEHMLDLDLMGVAVPVEVHMKSIQTGLERLRKGRI